MVKDLDDVPVMFLVVVAGLFFVFGVAAHEYIFPPSDLHLGSEIKAVEWGLFSYLNPASDGCKSTVWIKYYNGTISENLKTSGIYNESQQAGGLRG